MGDHPASCDCGDTDPRVVQCQACGRTHVYRPSGCPLCAGSAAKLRLVAHALNDLTAFLRLLMAAYESGDNAHLHELMTVARKKVE